MAKITDSQISTQRPSTTPDSQIPPKSGSAFGRKILEYMRRIPILRLLVSTPKATPLSERVARAVDSDQPTPLPKAKLVKDIDPEFRGLVRKPPSVFAIKEKEVLGEGAFGKVSSVERKKGLPGIAKTSAKLDRAYIIKEQEIHSQPFTRVGQIYKEFKLQKTSPDTPKVGPQMFNPLKRNHKVVMEHGGLSLKSIWTETGKIPENRTRGISKAILLQLKEMHARGIVHRDVKPDNMLMNQQGKVTLVDFGLAKKGTPNSASQFSGFIGSPLFMAPEIYEGKIYSHNVDLWALGITLYSMLEGGYPLLLLKKDQEGKQFIDEKSLSNLLHKINTNTHLDRDTRDFLLCLLTADPEQRISAEEALQHPFFTNHNDITKMSFSELQSQHRQIGKQIVQLEIEREQLENHPKRKKPIPDREQRLAKLNQQIKKLGATAGALQDWLTIRELESQKSSLMNDQDRLENSHEDLSIDLTLADPDTEEHQKLKNKMNLSREHIERSKESIKQLQGEIEALVKAARKMPD